MESKILNNLFNMRGIFTTFLILLTTLLGAWFVSDLWVHKLGDYGQDVEHRILGSPLYDDEAIINTYTITLTNKNKIPHHFTFNRNYQWECTTPYQDRADGINYLKPLIEFTLGAEVVDAIPLSQVDPKSFGFEDDWVKVQFADKDGNEVAKFKIGIRSAWHKRVVTTDERQQTKVTDIPTVFVIKENAPDQKILYLVADPAFGIHKIFKNDFEGFRDHRPFALNRNSMEEVSIKRSNSEIVVDHSTSTSPWRISKPLDLATDRKEIAKLLTQLSALEAVKIHPKENITLPGSSEDIIKVSVKNRYVDEQSTLTIYPSEKGAPTCYATMNDRPGIIFELPKQANSNNKNSLAALPTSINEIRAKNMLTLDRKNIRQFIVSPAFKSCVNVARKKLDKEYELISSDGSTQKINDFTLSNLIAAISVVPVRGFVSDAATDLSKYNFQNPILDVTVFPFAGVPQRVTFAEKAGIIYAHSRLSSVVWEVDKAAYGLISQNQWEWKDNTLWSLIVNDVTSFSMENPQTAQKLTVNYDYIGDAFTGKLNNADISDKINPIQAKFFLNNAHYITAQKRLGPNDANAAKALETPILNVSISSSTYNDEGLPTGKSKEYTISIAKPRSQMVNPPYYYAKTSNDEDYLIISPTTYQYLSTDIFAEE